MFRGREIGHQASRSGIFGRKGTERAARRDSPLEVTLISCRARHSTAARTLEKGVGLQ
jgi:hypothetical protein